MLIESERLLFRRYTDADFDFLMTLLSDSEVMRFIGAGKTRDISGGRVFLKWIYSTYKNSEDMGLMMLINKEDQIPIGHAGLVPQTINGNDEIEIGYWINRKHWGKGYGTEAARALVEYGRNKYKNQRFIALIQPGNTASQKIAKTIGMQVSDKIIVKGQKVEVYSTN